MSLKLSFNSSTSIFHPKNPLHKIFNRNNIKVSYSCMDNVKSNITRTTTAS
jgi:hypothetical protein